MRKIISIFLTFLILYNVLGYFIVFKSFQYSIRCEIKRNIENKIPDCDLTIVKVVNNSDQCENKAFIRISNSEFRFLGKLYDIVRIKVSSDTTYYYCLNDTQEEQLYSALDGHVKRNMDQNSSSKDKTNNILKSIVKQVIINDNSSWAVDEFFSEFLITNSEKPSQIYYYIPTPPPKSLI